MSKVAAIIPAAGSGTRMGLDYPKQFHLLAGAPVLVHTVRRFLAAECVACVVVVAPPEQVEFTRDLLQDNGALQEEVSVVAGGKRRQDSVQCGLRSLSPEMELVLVHDGARPLVTTDIISRCADAADRFGAAIAAVPVKDTLKKSDGKSRIKKTVARQDMWQAQTPQAARVSLLAEAYAAAGKRDVTDEASLLELAGIDVHLVEGAETNFKITRPDDLLMAESLMVNDTVPQQRIGHGYDAHRFSADRDLVLGGVTIPFELGLAGHSDADVLTHALCDAILGALGAGDIGKHFPDSDASFSNVYSIKLLEHVIALGHERGFILGNADITVVCQRPKLAGHVEEMKQKVSEACKVSAWQINIKATTTEKMGFTGRMEGISCHCVVLLLQKESESNG